MEEHRYPSYDVQQSTTPTTPTMSIRQRREQPDVPEDAVSERDFLMEHLNDPNYDYSFRPRTTPPPGYNASRNSLTESESVGGDKKKIYSDYYNDSESGYERPVSRNSTAVDFDDESPYPEVRAAVASVDDPLIPVCTFRMWFLGLVFSAIVSGLNQVFSMRFPSVIITGIVVQLISLPFGKALERILPTRKVSIFGYTFSLNPGPFSIKEHVCITVMANVSVGGAYVTDVIATQKIFYNQQVGFSYKILVALGTQILGFSLGGLLRQFVVYPASMIWPTALVNSALFNTLHKNYGKKDAGHSMTRERFFLYVLIGSFVWYWVPGYLFTALSMFNWVCWIAPNNVAVNALFGTNTGLGMGLLSFDWSMISFIGSPLVTPWWSELNTLIALVFFFWFIVPIIYFTNTFNTAYLPISIPLAFDNTGFPYNASAIITNGVFDLEKYRAYSPVYVSATLLMAYGLSFAAFSSIFVHTFLWFRRDIARRLRSGLKDERDIHSRLMQAYPEVPNWWYLIVGVISFIFTVIAIEIFPTELPIWGAAVAFLLPCVLVIPLSMLQAITNQSMPLQVMHEMIAGYLLPGRPIANVLFKSIAYVGTNQGISFAADLKLGHYMKIPPRMMFSVQVIASAVACIVSVSVQDWMFANVEDICTFGQANGFICPTTNTFATASLIWGGIGPQRLFSPGQPYSPLLWFFLIGAFLPIPFFFLARRYPLSIWRYINIPIFFSGINTIPPATGMNYASWGIVGFIFNFLIRRIHFRWWQRYNYILSAGLDAGVAIGLVVIFFAVQYPTNGKTLDWIGNTIWQNTADYNGMPLRFPNSDTGTFGPSTWS